MYTATNTGGGGGTDWLSDIAAIGEAYFDYRMASDNAAANPDTLNQARPGIDSTGEPLGQQTSTQWLAANWLMVMLVIMFIIIAVVSLKWALS